MIQRTSSRGLGETETLLMWAAPEHLTVSFTSMYLAFEKEFLTTREIWISIDFYMRWRQEMWRPNLPLGLHCVWPWLTYFWLSQSLHYVQPLLTSCWFWWKEKAVENFLLPPWLTSRKEQKAFARVWWSSQEKLRDLSQERGRHTQEMVAKQAWRAMSTEESLKLETKTDFTGDSGEIETHIWTCLIFLKHFNSLYEEFWDKLFLYGEISKRKSQGQFYL